jgi:hypothetical protein
MTHKDLVRRVGAWLRGRKGCNVVMLELATKNSETPDAIGFHGAGCSILIECKASRSDFHADKDKWFRQFEDMGVGDVRYFAAPKGLLTPSDMPDGWGLLEVSEHQIREVCEPSPKAANKRAEVIMLTSAIRRLEISTAVYVQQGQPL